ATAARESSVDNANRTASRRNSSGYFEGRAIGDPLLWPHTRIRCPPERVNSKPHEPHRTARRERERYRAGCQEPADRASRHFRALSRAASGVLHPAATTATPLLPFATVSERFGRLAPCPSRRHTNGLRRSDSQL